jgi:hypothetical protein
MNTGSLDNSGRTRPDLPGKTASCRKMTNFSSDK